MAVSFPNEEMGCSSEQTEGSLGPSTSLYGKAVGQLEARHLRVLYVIVAAMSSAYLCLWRPERSSGELGDVVSPL
jgi:hypothetical protein